MTIVRPPGRYGEPRFGRRSGIAAAAVLALAGTGFVVWAGLHAATPDVRAGLLGFDGITERSVTVQIEVVKDPEATAVCRLRAQNLANATVGAAEVVLAPPEHGRRSVVTVTIPTSQRPVNGELRGCERR